MPAYERAAVVRAPARARWRWHDAPTGFGHALSALDLHLATVKEVAIVGSTRGPATQALAAEVTVRRFLPEPRARGRRPDDRAALEAVPLLRERVALEGKPTAYVCERFTCRLPVTEPEALRAQLDTV